MKVRCIKEFQYTLGGPTAPTMEVKKGDLFKTDDNGLTNIVINKDGYNIMAFDDERFFEYFEFVDEKDGVKIAKECLKDSKKDNMMHFKVDGSPDEYIPFDGSKETQYSFIKETLINISKLIEKKNTDYGDSYTKTRDKYGHTAFLIRLSDKINRYEKLMQNDKLVDDESLIDTLKDIIGYTALEIEYLEVNDG